MKAGMDQMLRGCALEAAECFKTCLKLLYENGAQNSQDAIRAEDKLRTCIGNMGETTFMDEVLSNQGAGGVGHGHGKKWKNCVYIFSESIE